MKKKVTLTLLALVCALCCAFGFAACGGDDPGKTDNGRPQTPSENLSFRLSDDEQSYKLVGIGSCTDSVVVIPSTYQDKPVTHIDSFITAFDKVNVTKVYIPDTVVRISATGFGNAAQTFRGKGDYSNIKYVDKWIVSGEKGISHITTVAYDKLYTTGIVGIADFAFTECYNLVSAQLPDSIKYIGYGAFGNSAFNYIDLPAGLVSIGPDAFYSAKSSSWLQFKGTMQQWKAVKKGENWNGKLNKIICSDGTLDANGNEI